MSNLPESTQEDPPNAAFPPFKRGRTGRRGVTKYIHLETGSWVTLNPDGSCHLGARHKYLGNLLEVAGELEQRKQYADAWRINMQRAERELEALKAEKSVELPLNEHTRHILGFMAMDCRPYAEMLRADGVEIPRKIEAEQATVLHWMLGYYLKHGANWREEAGKYVTAHIEARKTEPINPQTSN